MAAALGTPFMPWQSLVADVAGERTPTGAYAYPVVVVTVPRQSGKTTLMRARLVTRCLAQRGAMTFYTAQTGKDARERWEDLVKQVLRSPLRSRVHVRRSIGSSRLEFWNDSQLRVFSPVEAAMHGSTPHEVHLDEAWSFDRIRGNALLGAITPAQITVPDRQLWIVSTAGTVESEFLRGWVDAGRAGAPGVALFEWSCPDGLDPYDADVIAGYHPAIGYTQTAADILASASNLSRAEYERAYANRWTGTVDAIITADDWAALAGDQTPPGAGVVLGYDVAHDRTSADIVASWDDGDGRLQVRVVRTDDGADWLAAAVLELADRMPGATFVADGAGPVRSVNDALAGRPQLAGGRLRVLTTAEYASACGELLADVRTGHLGHDGGDRLARAVAAVVTRPLGDLWVWSRTRSKASVSALTAATVAAYVARHPADPEPAPFIRTGDDAD